MFDALGINIDKALNDCEKLTGKKNKDRGSPAPKPVKKAIPQTSMDDAFGFFEKMADESMQKPQQDEEPKMEESEDVQMIKETISRNSNWNVGPESIVKRNLLVGNVEGAAESLLKCGRPTEALLLALTCKEQSVFEDIKDHFFEQSKDPFITSVIQSLVNEKEDAMIIEMAHKNWKEALAYCLSYIDKSDLLDTLDKLGDELEKKKDHNSALICYILSKKIDKVAKLWKHRVESIIKTSPEHKELMLMNFLEKMTHFRNASNINDDCTVATSLITDICDFLTQNGLGPQTLNYLQLHGYNTPRSSLLAHRIYTAGSQEQFGPGIHQPKLPFVVQRMQPTAPQKQTQEVRQEQRVQRGGRPMGRGGKNMVRKGSGQFTQPAHLQQKQPIQQNQFDQKPFTPTHPMQQQNIQVNEFTSAGPKPVNNGSGSGHNYGYGVKDPIFGDNPPPPKVRREERKGEPVKRQRVSQVHAQVFNPAEVTAAPPIK